MYNVLLLQIQMIVIQTLVKMEEPAQMDWLPTLVPVLMDLKGLTVQPVSALTSYTHLNVDGLERKFRLGL